MPVVRMDKLSAHENEDENGRNFDQDHDVVGLSGFADSSYQNDSEDHHYQKCREIKPKMPAGTVKVISCQVLQTGRQIGRRNPAQRRVESKPVEKTHQMRGKPDTDSHIAD